jgi:hypothetical protein
MNIFRVWILFLCIPGFVVGMEEEKEPFQDKFEAKNIFNSQEDCTNYVNALLNDHLNTLRNRIKDLEKKQTACMTKYNQSVLKIKTEFDSLSNNNIGDTLSGCIVLVDDDNENMVGEQTFLNAFQVYHNSLLEKIATNMTTVSIKSTDQLKLVTMELFGTIQQLVAIIGNDKKEIAAVYDRLVNIRKFIIENGKKFNPIYFEELNPFNISSSWYTFLYRPLNTLPAAPWNESIKGENRVLVHCKGVRSQLSKGKAEDQPWLMLYLLTMRELRIVVHNYLQGRAGALKSAALIGGAGLAGLAYRYFFGGAQKKSGKNIKEASKESPRNEPMPTEPITSDSLEEKIPEEGNGAQE